MTRLISMFRKAVLGFLGLRKTYSMAIVRRYADANGAFVGELYLLGTFAGAMGYQMIGNSLDTLPLEAQESSDYVLDLKNDFLAPLKANSVRVGASEPQDNDAVRENVARLDAEGKIVFQIQNRFIEYQLSGKGDTQC